MDQLLGMREDESKAAIVEEGIAIAESVGVLAALFHLADKGIPSDVSRRLLRGDVRKSGANPEIHTS